MALNRLPHTLTLLVRFGILCGTLTVLSRAQSTGALGSGLGAAAMGRGGTLVVEAGDPLDAIEGNPAGLAGIHAPTLEFGGVAALAAGSFRNTVDAHGSLSGVAGAIPYAAFAAPLGSSRWRAAAAFTPEMLMSAHWSYIDPPGTVGITYGKQKNESKIVALRSSVGVARTLDSHWSVGATVGMVYNTNTLHAPYIFQWQPRPSIRLGAAWKSGTAIASALFTALGIAADPSFRYRAEVDNHLPQTVAFGLSSKWSRGLRYALEGDWTDWSHAFRQLPVTLAGGTNAVINSVVGANAFQDAVPLHWHNQSAVHAGVELPIRERATLRADYTLMSNPVPSTTLTPLTAAILRHTLAAGAGAARGRWGGDAAYQVQLPAAASVDRSSLLAGEYDASRVRVLTQTLAATVRVAF